MNEVHKEPRTNVTEPKMKVKKNQVHKEPRKNPQRSKKNKVEEELSSETKFKNHVHKELSFIKNQEPSPKRAKNRVQQVHKELGTKLIK